MKIYEKKVTINNNTNSNNNDNHNNHNINNNNKKNDYKNMRISIEYLEKNFFFLNDAFQSYYDLFQVNLLVQN